MSCARRAISEVAASSETSRSSVCTSVPKRTPEGRPGARSVGANVMRGCAPYGPSSSSVTTTTSRVLRRPASSRSARRLPPFLVASAPRHVGAGLLGEHLLLAQAEVLRSGRPQSERVPPHHLVPRHRESVQAGTHRRDRLIGTVLRARDDARVAERRTARSGQRRATVLALGEDRAIERLEPAVERTVADRRAPPADRARGWRRRRRSARPRPRRACARARRSRPAPRARSRAGAARRARARRRRACRGCRGRGSRSCRRGSRPGTRGPWPRARSSAARRRRPPPPPAPASTTVAPPPRSVVRRSRGTRCRRPARTSARGRRRAAR